MWRFRNISAGVLFVLMMPSASAQSVPNPPPLPVPSAQSAWPREAAQKESSGMRRYSLAVCQSLLRSFADLPADQFSGSRAFASDFDAAIAMINPDAEPAEWTALEIGKLVVHNPNYWRAVYEQDPGAPLMMWLHSALHGLRGEIHSVLYTQILLQRSQQDVSAEMSRLLISALKLIRFGEQANQIGVKLHDQEKYAEAETHYRDVLSVIPNHSQTLYELGYSVRQKIGGREGDIAAQQIFNEARTQDPFRLSAWQGSFKGDELQQMLTLRSEAKPRWDKLIRSKADDVTLEQLESLSEQLQMSGVHELALLTRQIVVVRRGGKFTEADAEFVGRSLQGLMPEHDFADVLAKLRN